jgi:uncharacterized protein (TIGR03435 family)
MGGRLPGAGLLVCAAGMAFGQPAPAGPSFEVASVKPAAPVTNGEIRQSASSDPGRVTYSNVTLRSLPMRAYQVKDYQILGPGWLAAERYDVAAKLAENAPKDQVPPMLQALLAERFKLTLHHEQKDIPAYGLVVARNGFKLKPVGDPPAGIHFSIGSRVRTMKGKLALAALANALSAFTGSPVLDMTGIEGIFDINLQWSPDDREQGLAGLKFAARDGGELAAGPGKAPDSPPEAPSGPSLFAAVQSLGLRLEPRKAPIDILVVDYAEKTPTEN